MQKQMGAVGEGPSHKIPVQLLNVRIFMRKTDGSIPVQGVKVLATFMGQLLAVVNGLPSAAYTAARAGHDFHKIIMYPAMLNGLNQFSHISQSADYRSADHGVTQGHFRLHNSGLKEGLRTARNASGPDSGRSPDNVQSEEPLP